MATFSIIADVMVRGLDSLKQLAKVSDEVADNAEDAGDALDGFSASAAKADKAAKRAGFGLDDAATAFRAMGASGTLAGDTLERFAIITSSKVGLAIGGAVVGIGAAVVAFKTLNFFVQKGIETNEEYTRGVETLTSELNRTAGILGQVLLDVIDFGGAVETSNKKVKDFNDSIVKDSTRVADSMRTVITFVLKGIKHIGNAVLGISGAFRAIGIALGGLGAAVATALGAIPDLATEMIMGAVAAIRAGLESLGAPTDILDKLFGTEAQIKARMRTATANADAAGAATRAIFAGVKGDLGNIVDDMEDFNDTIDNMISRMNAARGTAARIKDPRTPRPPGTPKPPAAPGEEMVFTVGEVEAVTTTPRLSTGETVAEFRARMDGYGVAINDLKAKLAAAGNESLAMETRIKAAGKAAGEMGANAFLQLGSGIAYAMGEMAAGASNLKDFGDAMANLAGQIAGSFGQLFIQLGAGFLLTAPAVGAGLIAAGLALQTLSGFLSGKGSGNRGGGGGGRSAASNAGRDIAREISRSLRPSGEDGPAVTNIEVVIGGRSIQPEMVAIVDDIARQRRSRYLGRRMGV